MGGIGQRAKDVEDGADADLTACRADMFHGGMIRGREHEAETDLLYATGNLLRAKVDACAQGFQDIGTATPTGGRTVAVLCYGSTGGSRYNSGGSRDVKGARTIAACATG